MRSTVVAMLLAAYAVSSGHRAPNQPSQQSPRESRPSFQPRRPAQWGSLEPGRYSVGFRSVAAIDQSRRVAPAVAFDGRRNPEPLAMALPLAVWYPATPGGSSRPMQYGMFAALSAKRTDLTPVTAADRRAATNRLREFAGFAFGRNLPESAARTLDTTLTAAYHEATPARGRFPVVLAETDGSVAAATVMFEYLASRGMVVIAVPSRLSYASVQVSRPNVVVEARVRDFEFLLEQAHHFSFVDTTRVAVLGVNFDGMAALAFQMKNMAARAVVSLDGWEGKASNIETVRSGLHYDPRRLRVPYLVVLQDEQSPPEWLRLDRTIFDAMRYANRQWLVLRSMSHSYLVGNPLAYPDVPPDKRSAYELLIRGVHRFLDASLSEPAKPLAALVTAEGDDGRSVSVKDVARVDAAPAVPDDEELEHLIMVDRAATKVATILRDARRTDSTLQLFSEQTMALYAFRFARQNDPAFALQLLELNTEAFPRSWSASDAVGDGYRDAGDTTRAVAAYARALELLSTLSPGDSTNRQAVNAKLGRLKR